MLVDDILTALPGLQAEAEGRMIDACTITRGGGEETMDPETGEYTTPAGSTIYVGKCEVQVSDSLSARDADAGGEVATILRLTLKVPVSVTGIRKNDVAVITGSMLDPDLVGRKFRVTAGHSKSLATARRMQVEELSL